MSDPQPLDRVDRRVRSLILTGAARAYGLRFHADYAPDVPAPHDLPAGTPDPDNQDQDEGE
jgi:hypothetical protein